MSAPPTGPTGPPGPEEGSKAPLVLGIALVLVLLVVGGAVLLLMSGGGDDGGDDEEAATDTTQAAAEVVSDDVSDEFDDFSDDFSEDPTDDEPDADLDGVPDAQDPDDDDDGVPDVDDPDDDGDGIPDGEDDVGDGDGDGEDEVGGEDPGDEDPPADLDLLRNDPRPAVDAWIDAAGDGAKAIEVVLYPEYGFADIRDSAQPNRLLEFGWRDGAVQGPEPTEPFPGTDLDAESFRMTAVNWDALPRLVANAPERAGLPAGEVTHVIVTSDLPFSDRFLFRIYVTAPNGSDYVIATIDGQPANR